MLEERSILKIHIPVGVLKKVPPETVEDKFSRKAEAMSKWRFQKITIWYDFHFMQWNALRTSLWNKERLDFLELHLYM